MISSLWKSMRHNAGGDSINSQTLTSLTIPRIYGQVPNGAETGLQQPGHRKPAPPRFAHRSAANNFCTGRGTWHLEIGLGRGWPGVKVDQKFYLVQTSNTPVCVVYCMYLSLVWSMNHECITRENESVLYNLTFSFGSWEVITLLVFLYHEFMQVE